MSGTDSLKGLISLSLFIEFNKNVDNDKKIEILEKHGGFKKLINNDLEEEKKRYNIGEIVFTNDVDLFFLYKFRDSESYVILQVDKKNIEGSRAFVVIRQDHNILEIPEEFLKECNMNWIKRVWLKCSKSSFKIKLKSKQNVQGYIAVDDSSVLPAIFPLEYATLKVNWKLLFGGLGVWSISNLLFEHFKDLPNLQALKSNSTLVNTLITMIFTYILKDDVAALLAKFKKHQNNKLALTGLAVSETVSKNASEISARVEKVNDELKLLNPIKE